MKVEPEAEEPELDEFAVPELPQLPHTGLTTNQQEDRRLLIGRMVAYHAPTSPYDSPFTIGQIKEYVYDGKKVCFDSMLVFIAYLR